MIPQRSYLFRAIYDWLIDNQWTPYLLVDAEQPCVTVPDHLVKDGKIVLNISPEAINDYFMDAEILAFSARFSGLAHKVVVPVEAMEALYAKENSMGIVFPEEEFSEPEEPAGASELPKDKAESPKAGDKTKSSKANKNKPKLKLV